MASLVADYGSSSGSDGEESDGSEIPDRQTSQDSIPGNDPLSFYLGYSASKDEEDDDGSDVDSKDRHDLQLRNQQSGNLLPRPNFAGSVALPGPTATLPGNASVFANPFLAAEEAKNQLLEKHVKMTPTTGTQGGRSGNRHVCWNFRKGRCRFGQNCRFGHDSDLNLANRHQTASTDDSILMPPQQSPPAAPPPPTSLTTNAGRGSNNNNRVARYVKNVGGTVDRLAEVRGRPARHRAEEEEEAGETQTRTKRKKPGLTNTLLPPKRSMKSFKQQQQQERPWLAQ